MSSKSVIVIGGGLAGLSSAVALADAGFRVRLLEQRPFLGGRAASYLLPGGEHVDNCQHVTLGCCTNLDDFYRRVGAAGKIVYHDSLVFVDRQGRRSTLEASALPVPLHLAASLALYSALDWSDRHAIGHTMMAIAAAGGKNEYAAGQSMFEWLRSHGQSQAAMRHFWSVILVSALNDDLERIDARYGLDVFWKAFLSSRAGYRLGLPSVPLSELYEGCHDAITSRGGEVMFRTTVRGLKVADDRVAEIDIGGEAEGATTLRADYYVLAVPHGPARELSPPQLIAPESVFARLHHLRSSPITGVHFWFDRDVMSDPFLVLVDRTTQWIFNKSRLYGGPGDGRYLQLVISASYGLVGSSRQQIIDVCLRELREVLPAAQNAALVKATVIKEMSATFSPEPGSDAWRPPQRTPLPNLFLAGDWTATGWPATMEGAVRSGYLAAEAVLTDAGTPRQILCPDLPAEGLARWFESHPNVNV